jgi:hypothetical protein
MNGKCFQVEVAIACIGGREKAITELIFFLQVLLPLFFEEMF